MIPTLEKDLAGKMAAPTGTQKLTAHANIASPTFLDLPLEVLYMIVALLEEEQLPSLRVISRNASNRLSDIFAKVHFAHIRHHLTKPSLEDLIGIANHATFSKYVKSIEFSTMHIKDPSVEFGLPETLDDLQKKAVDFRKSGGCIAMLASTSWQPQSHSGSF